MSCEIVSTSTIPPKWSDHAAVVAEFRDVEPVPRHPPCALSSQNDKRWNDRSQRTLHAMFAGAVGRKRKAPNGGAAEAGASQAGAPAAGAGEGHWEGKRKALDAVAGAREEQATGTGAVSGGGSDNGGQGGEVGDEEGGGERGRGGGGDSSERVVLAAAAAACVAKTGAYRKAGTAAAVEAGEGDERRLGPQQRDGQQGQQQQPQQEGQQQQGQREGGLGACDDEQPLSSSCLLACTSPSQPSQSVGSTTAATPSCSASGVGRSGVGRSGSQPVRGRGGGPGGAPGSGGKKAGRGAKAEKGGAKVDPKQPSISALWGKK